MRNKRNKKLQKNLIVFQDSKNPGASGASKNKVGPHCAGSCCAASKNPDASGASKNTVWAPSAGSCSSSTARASAACSAKTTTRAPATDPLRRRHPGARSLERLHCAAPQHLLKAAPLEVFARHCPARFRGKGSGAASQRVNEGERSGPSAAQININECRNRDCPRPSGPSTPKSKRHPNSEQVASQLT